MSTEPSKRLVTYVRTLLMATGAYTLDQINERAPGLSAELLELVEDDLRTDNPIPLDERARIEHAVREHTIRECIARLARGGAHNGLLLTPKEMLETLRRPETRTLITSPDRKGLDYAIPKLLEHAGTLDGLKVCSDHDRAGEYFQVRGPFRRTSEEAKQDIRDLLAPWNRSDSAKVE